jgi:hypothetical protein
MSTKLVDRGWNKIWRNIQALDGQSLAVGILGGVEYAGWLEFGTSRMKPRPFMRQTFESKGGLMEAAIAAAWGRILGGSGASAEANKLGNFYRSEIQRTIKNGSFAPLSAQTIARKGSSKPLIDTGRLIGSIAYELR